MRGVLALVVVTLLASLPGCASRTLAEPPQGSPVLTRSIELAFPTQGNDSILDPPTYRYYMAVPRYRSLPSQNKWVPYAETEPFIRSDADRLWGTGKLESLWVEVRDEPWTNGVRGKRIVFNLVERDGEPVVPTGPPRLPTGFEEPTPGHERVYP